MPGLESMLDHPDDIKVPIQMMRWQYSDAEPNPPLELVLQSTFWADDKYSDVHDLLRRPQPSIEVTIGGDYVTINTAGGVPQQVAGEQRAGHSQPEQPHGRRHVSHCFFVEFRLFAFVSVDV